MLGYTHKYLIVRSFFVNYVWNKILFIFYQNLNWSFFSAFFIVPIGSLIRLFAQEGGWLNEEEWKKNT